MVYTPPAAAQDGLTRYDAARDTAIVQGIVAAALAADKGTETELWDRFTDRADTVTTSGSWSITPRRAGANYTLSGGANGTPCVPRVIGGRLTYAPGALSGACAGYAELALTSAMRRIGGKFTLSAGFTTGNGSAVLIGWASSLAASFPIIPDSPCHLAISSVGWQYLVWQNNVQTSIGSGTWATPLVAGTVYSCEVFLDTDAAKAYLFLPDGSQAVVTHPLIGSVKAISACWEMYRQATTDFTAQFLATWADSGGESGPQRAQRASVAQQPTKVAFWQGSDIAVPTSDTDIDATNLAVTFTAPASGRVLVEMTGFLAMTGAGQVLWGIRSGSTQLGLSTVVNGQVNQNIHARFVYNVTPGASYTLKWSHWCTVNGVATLKLVAGSGYSASLKVTPLVS